MSMPPYFRTRIVVGIEMLLCMIGSADYYFDLGILGQHDKSWLIGSFVALALTLMFFAPSIQEMRERRNAAKNSD